MIAETNKTEKNKMTKKQAIKVLRIHQQWRRGDGDVTMRDPIVIGEAIDTAIRLLSKPSKRRTK